MYLDCAGTPKLRALPFDSAEAAFATIGRGILSLSHVDALYGVPTPDRCEVIKMRDKRSNNLIAYIMLEYLFEIDVLCRTKLTMQLPLSCGTTVSLSHK